VTPPGRVTGHGYDPCPPGRRRSKTNGREPSLPDDPTAWPRVRNDDPFARAPARAVDPWLAGRPDRALRLALPHAHRLSLRSGAIVPDAVLQDAVVVMLRGALLVSVGPRTGPRGPHGPGSPTPEWICAGLIGPGDTWCGMMPARPSLASTGRDGATRTAFRPSLGEPSFHARAIGPAVVSIASATRAVTTRGPDARVWAALSHAQGSTAWMLAAALANRTLPVRDRLRAELRDLAARFGRDMPGGRRIELPLTQDVLAELVGSARETVNRALRGLAKETWFEGRTYVVRAPGSPGPAGGSV
jgi:hypothetical protein